jgi:glycosyltransferase involved in cell wall biosynthesis
MNNTMSRQTLQTILETISVVIPLYNKAPYIERAIRSVLVQTVAPDEIIVVDDGSTDGGGDLVEAIQHPLIKLVRQENQGVSVARNRGIALARGELIAFLDADDAWEPQYLEEIYALRRRFPEAGAYATAVELVDRQGSRRRPPYAFPVPDGGQVLMEFFVEGALDTGMFTPAVAAPKAVLQEVGGFMPGELLSQDRDVWLKIALRYPIAWSHASLVKCYMDPVHKNRMRQERLFSREPAISQTARAALASGRLTPEQADRLRELAAGYQMLAALHCLRQGKKQEARQILEYARGTRRFCQEWKWYWTLLARLPGNLFPVYEEIKDVERRLRKQLKGFALTKSAKG